MNAEQLIHLYLSLLYKSELSQDERRLKEQLSATLIIIARGSELAMEKACQDTF